MPLLFEVQTNSQEKRDSKRLLIVWLPFISRRRRASIEYTVKLKQQKRALTFSAMRKKERETYLDCIDCCAEHKMCKNKRKNMKQHKMT